MLGLPSPQYSRGKEAQSNLPRKVQGSLLPLPPPPSLPGFLAAPGRVSQTPVPRLSRGSPSPAPSPSFMFSEVPGSVTGHGVSCGVWRWRVGGGALAFVWVSKFSSRVLSFPFGSEGRSLWASISRQLRGLGLPPLYQGHQNSLNSERLLKFCPQGLGADLTLSHPCSPSPPFSWEAQPPPPPFCLSPLKSFPFDFYLPKPLFPGSLLTTPTTDPMAASWLLWPDLSMRYGIAGYSPRSPDLSLRSLSCLLRPLFLLCPQEALKKGEPNDGQWVYLPPPPAPMCRGK